MGSHSGQWARAAGHAGSRAGPAGPRRRLRRRAERGGTFSGRWWRQQAWWLKRSEPDRDPGGCGLLGAPRARGAGSLVCAPAGRRGPRPARHDELPGESGRRGPGPGARGGVRASASADRRPRTGFEVTAQSAPGAVPSEKELNEWHFLPDLRVLGTAGRWRLRGAATRQGSEVLEPLSRRGGGARRRGLRRIPEPVCPRGV